MKSKTKQRKNISRIISNKYVHEEEEEDNKMKCKTKQISKYQE